MNISENKRVVVMGAAFSAAFIGLITLGFNFISTGQDNIANLETDQGLIESMKAKRFVPNEKILPEVKQAAAAAKTVKEQILASTAPFKATVAKAVNIDGRPITGKELQDKLNKLHNNLEKLCKEKNVALNAEASWLGFSAFRSITPTETAAPDLSFELSGIDHLVNTVADNGAVAINKVYRSANNAADVKDAKPAAKKTVKPGDWTTTPFEISFQVNRGALPKILETLAHDKEYCYYITGMRISSDLTTLPPMDAYKKPVAPQPDETATVTSDISDAGLTGDGLTGEPEAAPVPVVRAPQIVAKQILGNETIRVYLACELVRFAQDAKKSKK